MTIPNESSIDRPARIFCSIALLVGIAVNLLVWLQPRGADLSDGNAFRQSQTAMTAKYLVSDGFKLAYETPVLGPPWSIPMEFPVYQSTVAALVRTTGLSLAPAGHLVSMLYFWATLPAVWLLLGRLQVAKETRRLALGLLLCSPVYLFYGRHFLIETTALCFGCWFLWAFHRALAPGGTAFGLLAVLLGTLGGLAKITTFFTFGFAAGLWLIVELRNQRGSWRWLVIWSALLMAVPLGVSYWWVRYSDGLKAENPYAQFLISSHLKEFNFGYPGQRLRWNVWARFYGMVKDHMVSEAALVLGAVGSVLLPARRRWLVGGCLLCYVIGLLVFVNLYFVHDYYFVASGVFVVVAVALCLEGLLYRPGLGVPLRAVVLAAVLLLQVCIFWRAYGDFFTHAPQPPPKMAAIVRQLTDPDDIVVVMGLDWNSRLLYFCDRRGLMMPANSEYNSQALQKSLDGVPPHRVGAFIVAGNFQENPHAIIPAARKMGVSLQPVAGGENMLLYLRKDRLAEIGTRLAGQHFDGVWVKFTYDASKDPQANMVDDDLTRSYWRGRFSMTTPAPSLVTSLFPITLPETNGTAVIATHAPNTIFFPIPAGARHFQAVYGMFDGAYTGKDFTDGVVVEVWEQLPDGNQIRHYQRTLLPHERPEDRGDQKIELNPGREFAGQMFLRVDPGPAGSINYDWLYWRTVKIY